jgi:2'-5' RNA ligase
MSEQYLLPGFEATLPADDGVFFAIFPDLAAAMDIERLAEDQRSKHGVKRKSLKKDRFHASLHGFGAFDGLPQNIVAAAQEAAANVDVPPFQVAFNYVASFSRGRHLRPLVLRGDDGLVGLMRLHETLRVALVKAGLGRWTTPHYTPHVTLLYDRRSVAEQSVAPIEWTVREFVLVHSLVGKTQHIPLARWPLRG